MWLSRKVLDIKNKETYLHEPMTQDCSLTSVITLLAKTESKSVFLCLHGVFAVLGGYSLAEVSWFSFKEMLSDLKQHFRGAEEQCWGKMYWSKDKKVATFVFSKKMCSKSFTWIKYWHLIASDFWPSLWLQWCIVWEILINKENKNLLPSQLLTKDK